MPDNTLTVKVEPNAELMAKVEKLERMVELLLESITVPQNTACALADVSRDTVRERVKSGEVEPLSTETSRRNYFTLKQVENLRPVRRKPQKKAN